MISRTRDGRWAWVLYVALQGVAVAVPAAAERGPSWIPARAWQAAERTARAQFDPRAKLFKTDATKAQSMGLAGAKGSAWIVGAQRAAPARRIGPALPTQTYYLVAKDPRGRWQATQLGGFRGYLSKVDARGVNTKLQVGVVGDPAKVCHGVQVSNATRLALTKGTALATKRSGAKTQVVYFKGVTPSSPYVPGVEANLSVSPAPTGRSGTVAPRDIPINISEMMSAQPLAR